MDFDLDPLEDILSEPAACNARAGAKFRPKANPQSRKEKHATTPANLTDSAKNIPVTSNTVGQDSLQTFSHSQIPDITSSTTTVADPLPTLPRSQEMGNNSEVFNSGHGNRNSSPMEFLSQHFIGKDHVDPKDTLHSELTVSNTHGDLQPDFARLGGETADIFCSLDDIFNDSPTTNVSTVRKFQPRVKVNAQEENELTDSCVVATGEEGSTSHDKAPMFHSSNDVDLEGGPGQSSLLSGATLIPFSFGSAGTSQEFVPPEAVNSRETGAFDYEELLINAEGLEREEHTFLESVPSDREYMDDELHPASTGRDYVNVSNVPFPAVTDRPPEFPVKENSIQHGDILRPNGSIPEVVDSQSVPIISSKESSRSRKRVMKNHSRNVAEVSQETLDERPIAAGGNESGKLTRRSRRKSSAHADSISGGAEEHMSPLAGPSKYSIVDEDVYSDDDNEYEVDASCLENARNAMPADQHKKAGRKRKNSSEEPDSSSNKTPKKKFSHSTRRNKRQLNKTLLETPEEEIDPRTLPLKDLILLGELREQKWKKDAAILKNSQPNRSVNNAFSEDAPYDPEDPFAFVQGPDTNEATPPKLNYHSYMKKRPKKKWLKQDTELFYQAIRQFGTDFTMIEQLFPALDSDPVRRRQLVKLKYKNEERRHPMQLHDALTNRSKDHSHFELVIEKLRQAEQHSDGDMESVGISGEADHNNSEINEVAESEPKEEVPNDIETVDDPEMHSPVKSVHVTEEDAYKWSGGESDFDDYVGY